MAEITQKIVVKGRELALLPLKTGAVRRILIPGLKRLKELPAEMDAASEMLGFMAQIVHASVKELAPELTAEDVEDALDPAELRQAYEAVCRAAQFKEREQGEAASLQTSSPAGFGG